MSSKTAQVVLGGGAPARICWSRVAAGQLNVEAPRFVAYSVVVESLTMYVRQRAAAVCSGGPQLNRAVL